ncbi:MAG: hypothetical protein CMJ18_18985 [Phycisphaeraceae bacterium]|nr:hypothetical protein [Phycisphaeraceae bacterium]
MDWSHARRVIRDLRSSLNRSASAADPKPVEVRGVCGVRVTLRDAGRTLGTGDAAPGVAGDDRADLAALGRSALRRALGVARPRSEAPVTAFDLDLQVAHDARQILIDADDRLDRHFAPGHHGLRLSSVDADGAHLAAWSWPASNLAANHLPHRQLAHLLRRAGMRPERDLDRLGRTRQPRLERLEVIHFVLRAGASDALRLFRGRTPRAGREMSERGVDMLARRVARHLVDRQRLGGSFHVVFKPTSDRFRKADSAPRETALAALALARHASLERRRGRADAARRADDAVRRAVVHLLKAINQRRHVTAAALTVMTMIEAQGLGAYREERQRLGLFLVGTPVVPESEADQAIIVAALVRMHAQTRSADAKAVAAARLKGLWSSIEGRRVVGALPWLIEAEIELGRLDAAHRVRHDDLVDLVAAIRSRQIVAPPEIGPDDVVGGFDLDPFDGRRLKSGAPAPDWRSAQGLAVIALARRHAPLMGDADAARWTLDGALAARFIDYLMFRESDCYYVRRPERVLGGVRSSLADNSLGLVPSAATLLGLVELRQAFAEVAKSVPTD